MARNRNGVRPDPDEQAGQPSAADLDAVAAEEQAEQPSAADLDAVAAEEQARQQTDPPPQGEEFLYQVVTPIRRDGKLYEPGNPIALTPEAAAAMPWAVKPITK